jgi:hypothetical protein
MMAALPHHPRVQEFARAQFEYLLLRWAELYEHIATVYGLRFKNGRTWDDVALLFKAVVESALVGARLDGAEPRLSTNDGVLAGAVLAMLPSLLEGTEDWEGCYPPPDAH